jgi:hypothetical protein
MNLYGSIKCIKYIIFSKIITNIYIYLEVFLNNNMYYIQYYTINLGYQIITKFLFCRNLLNKIY